MTSDSCVSCLRRLGMTARAKLRVWPHLAQTAEVSRSLGTLNHLLQRGRMGEAEEERDNVGKLFEDFVQASTCKGTLQAFSVLCRRLDIDPADNDTFYSSLKAKVTSWKANALWSKLDKRTSQKEYKNGQACMETKVHFIISLSPQTFWPIVGSIRRWWMV